MDKAISFMPFFLVGLAFLSWIYGIIEAIGSQSFENFFFKIGIKVVKRVEHMPKQSSVLRIDHVYEGKEGKFKFLERNECVFLSKLHLLNLFRVSTPFALRCRATWNVPHAESYATVEGRFPLGPTVFFCCWMLLMMQSIVSLYTPLVLGVVLFAAAPVLTGFGYFVEKMRFNKMVNELRVIVSGKSVGK